MSNLVKIYRGDVYWVKPIPCTGSEQEGGRPAVIVSNDTGNRYAPTVEVVFLTSADKNKQPTHVEIQCKVPSVALCENIHTVSKMRLGGFIKSCSTSEIKRIDEALLISLGLFPPTKITESVTKEQLEELHMTPVMPMVVEPTAAEIERDLYAKLYDQLLNILIGEMSA